MNENDEVNENTNKGKKTKITGTKESTRNDDRNLKRRKIIPNPENKSKDKSTSESSNTSKTADCTVNDTTPKPSASGKSKKEKSSEKKHSKHLCKKCYISFATSCLLSKHVRNFHDFSRVSSDEQEEDEIQVIHNDNDILATVHQF